MEEAIRELERRIRSIETLVDSAKGQDKITFLSCLQNAQQSLANFREVDRILKQNNPSSEG